MKRILTICLAVMLLTAAQVMTAAAQATNLLQNPGFDSQTFTLIATDPLDPNTTYNAPLGWWGGIVYSPHDAFWMNVTPNGFPHSAGFKRSGIFSYNMGRGGATFTAYLYQQVSVMPNTDVQGGAWAFLENKSDARTRVGIDPTGGTDPFGANVVWSPFSGALYQWNFMSVNAHASAGVVTLFLYATQSQPSDPNGTYWDEAFLNGIPGPGGITTSTSTSATPAQTAQVASSVVRVNVRSGAGTDFTTIGKMNPGQRFAVLEQAGEWVKIDFNGQAGFVFARFVTISQGQPSAPSQAVAPASALDFTLSYTVRLRSAPTTSSDTLTRINFKTVVQAVGRSADNAWLQVIFNGQTGWIAARYGRLSGDISSLPIH
jgi:uncharacterized protein YraI